MRELITDEMVEIAHAVIDREIGAECPTPSECAACDAHQATAAILEAAAPVIAATALREAADDLEDTARAHEFVWTGGEVKTAIRCAAQLRARADAMEAEQ